MASFPLGPYKHGNISCAQDHLRAHVHKLNLDPSSNNLRSSMGFCTYVARLGEESVEDVLMSTKDH